MDNGLLVLHSERRLPEQEDFWTAWLHLSNPSAGSTIDRRPRAHRANRLVWIPFDPPIERAIFHWTEIAANQRRQGQSPRLGTSARLGTTTKVEWKCEQVQLIIIAVAYAWEWRRDLVPSPVPCG